MLLCCCCCCCCFWTSVNLGLIIKCGHRSAIEKVTFQALALKVDFHCRVSGSDFYVRTQINFTSVNRMEAIYGRLRVNVNVPPSLPSWSMPRYHWKSQCTAVLNLDPRSLSCRDEIGLKIEQWGAGFKHSDQKSSRSFFALSHLYHLVQFVECWQFFFWSLI